MLEHTHSGNPRTHKLVIAILAAAFTSIFYINFCNLVYQCGCRSLWNGADAMCNVHSHGTKHCPWCAIGLAGSVAVWASIVGVQILIATRPDTDARVDSHCAVNRCIPGCRRSPRFGNRISDRLLVVKAVFACFMLLDAAY